MSELQIRPRISAKVLAELNLPDVCERCFGLKWLFSQQPRVGGRQLPFQFGVPGVFSSIDSFTKNVVRSWLDKVGAPPPWFPWVGWPVVGYLDPKLLHWSKFQFFDEATGILLTASPDEVLILDEVLSQEPHVLTDYKCARITDTQDSLFPLYHAQLNTEAFMGRATGLLRPAGLGLLYTEPLPGANGEGEELAMPFRPVWRPVAVDPDLPRQLLGRAKAAMDAVNSGALPHARPGCPDCCLLARFRATCGSLGLTDG